MIPLSLAAAALADPSVGWRMNGLGVFPDAKPPVKWSATENVIWTTPLPGKSNASPILVGDRIFICSEPSTLLCVSAKDGAILWSRSNKYIDAVPESERARAIEDQAKAERLPGKLAELESGIAEASEALKKAPGDAALKSRLAKLESELQEGTAALKAVEGFVVPKTSEETGYATPTPASDGKQVYVAFGTGIVACFDLDGHRRWARRLATHPTAYSEPRLYGVSESPLLAGGRLLVHLLKLTALDPGTGKTEWEADAEVHFSSPISTRVGETDVVITACGDIFRISDGKVLASKLWPSKFLPLNTCSTPIVAGDTVYLVGKGGGAVRIKPAADGGVTTEAVWACKAVRDWCIASPVYSEGLLYTMQKGGRFTVIDAATGKSVNVEPLDITGDNYPSVALAGPYLYASNNAGQTVVIKPGREFAEVGRNTLEPFNASPIFAGNRMYIRAKTHLYCIGTK